MDKPAKQSESKTSITGLVTQVGDQIELLDNLLRSFGDHLTPLCRTEGPAAAGKNPDAPCVVSQVEQTLESFVDKIRNMNTRVRILMERIVV